MAVALVPPLTELTDSEILHEIWDTLVRTEGDGAATLSLILERGWAEAYLRVRGTADLHHWYSKTIGVAKINFLDGHSVGGGKSWGQAASWLDGETEGETQRAALGDDIMDILRWKIDGVWVTCGEMTSENWGEIAARHEHASEKHKRRANQYRELQRTIPLGKTTAEVLTVEQICAIRDRHQAVLESDPVEEPEVE